MRFLTPSTPRDAGFKERSGERAKRYPSNAHTETETDPETQKYAPCLRNKGRSRVLRPPSVLRPSSVRVPSFERRRVRRALCVFQRFEAGLAGLAAGWAATSDSGGRSSVTLHLFSVHLAGLKKAPHITAVPFLISFQNLDLSCHFKIRVSI